MECQLVEILKSITPIVLASLIGIVVTAYFAIVNIRKAAYESRASRTHSKMIEALQENVSIYRKALILLGAVLNKNIYTNRHKGVNDENAVDRYWNEIDNLTKRYEEVAPQLQLFLPIKLFKLSKEILNSLNQARDIVDSINSIPSSPDVNNTNLKEKVESINKDYFQFIEDSRSVLGTNVLGSIGKKKDFTTELYGSELKNK